MGKKELVVIEPFYTGSHRSWADGIAAHSKHHVTLLTLPGRHWKWRMHGAAVYFAEELNKLGKKVDQVLCSDMMDLSLFAALTRKSSPGLRIDLYFHENQLSYPWSPDDSDRKNGRDRHYAFINWTSALSADHVYFNSAWNRNSFLKALPAFLKVFPDARGNHLISSVEEKSEVLYFGMDLLRIPQKKKKTETDVPLLIWNHRWEYDKNPELFFNTLFQLQREGLDFRLIVTGESYQKVPEIFKEAEITLAEKILHFGYVESTAEYLKLLHSADIIPVTSVHDFFGVSAVQAMYAGCYPVMPDALAYPEHIPGSSSINLYKEGEFKTALEKALKDFRQYNPEPVRKHLLRYDWRNLAPQYDERLGLNS